MDFYMLCVTIVFVSLVHYMSLLVTIQSLIKSGDIRWG